MAIDYGDPSLSPIIPEEIPSSQRVNALKAKREYDKIIAQRRSIEASNREIKKKYGEGANAEQVRQLQQIQKQRALQQYQASARKTAQQVAFTERQQAYAKTRTGKFSAGLKQVGSLFSSGGLRNWSYGGQIAPRAPTAGRARIGRGRPGPGRPVGTKDPRYAAYGGVYGYRNMAQQRALERIQAARNANLSPEQQQIVNRVAQEQQARRFDPERQVIPDTRGTVPLKKIQDDIDAACNLFD
jgi:hypothetical protein